jgi:hypothetical protein
MDRLSLTAKVNRAVINLKSNIPSELNSFDLRVLTPKIVGQKIENG